MKIAELTLAVDNQGSINIPTSIVQEMGLTPGSHVQVSYLTQDGVRNDFQELMLLPDTLSSSEGEMDMPIHIPTQLMEQANIPVDADVQIACLDGALVICQDTGLRPEEMQAVLESLQTAEALASALPDEFPEVLSQLERMIYTIQEGEEADE